MLPPDQDIRNRLLVARLPALPHILLKLMEYCRTDDIGMNELAGLISKDPAIATKVLSVANSSAYHRSGYKIGLEQSLMSIGTDMIRTLVISESVFQTLNGFTTSNSINLSGFWKHSLTAAVMARDIARKMGYPNIDEAYLGGLLHDVGRLAFLAISPNEYTPYFHATDDAELCALEERTMQITHPEAGAWLVERWKLDSYLADSVLYHHETVARLETAHPLIRIVCLANQLASYPYDTQPVEQAAKLCGLKTKELKTIHDSTEKKVMESADFLGISLGGADKVPPFIPHVQPTPAQKKLNEELHYIVQASETQRTFAKQASESKLQQTVIRSARILFNLDDAVILLLDKASQTLTGNHGGDHRQRLSEFSLPLVRSSAVAEAAMRKHPTFISSKHHPLGVADEQLLRMLGAEWIVCLPLVSGEECLGLFIGSSSRLQIADLHRNAAFLQAFASQATSAMLSLRSKQAEARSEAAIEIEELRMSSRKIAHEVNNPLAIIKNYLNVLSDKMGKEDSISEELSILNEEIDRVSRIMNEFSDPQSTTRLAVIDLNKVVLDVVRIFRDTSFAPSSVNIRTMLDGQPSETDCDDGAIRQVLINLLKNAIEAMPGKGEIIITNRGHVMRDNLLFINLSVSDNGPGIPANHLEKLFQPVSSRKVGENRGLGLSIVHDLINKMSGSITCKSGKNGTSFEIQIPVQSRSSTTGF